ncbi:hypothetical protein [Actinomadura litoris]|uniref:Uncharacterized protein n=1 Tax=Actinomadura litoris TaxID=2678616 RepID=A0A7K1LB05_9ACTN|nr:hypothetical protein [Actinomadura litoris]MUN41426.1 hypothetical protein [Actinomadura litoris]
MNTALHVLAAVVGTAVYLALGVRYAAHPFIAREVEQSCQRWPSLMNEPGKIESWRRTAAIAGVGLAPLWPAYLLYRVAINALVKTAPLSPTELRRQVTDRDRRIAELERELGLR